MLDGIAAVLPRLRAGDDDAFAAMHDLLAPMLGSLALGVVRDAETAADVVQDAFVAFVVALPGLEMASPRAVRAWLATTTRNRALDVLRSAERSRRADVEVGGVELADEPGHDPVAITDPEMAAALEALPEDQRSALLLTHVAGLSAGEAGAALGRSRTAVYGLVRRGQRALRTSLGSRGRSGRA